MTRSKNDAEKRLKASPIDIRPPFFEDFPDILGISNWATCHTTANFRIEPDTLEYWVDLWRGEAERYPWFVAEVDGSVIGFAMVRPFKDRCGCASSVEVSVYVDPKFHGQGVGSALYGTLIPALVAQGFTTVVAVIAIPNLTSECLHEAYGFKKIGVLSRVGWKFNRWHDVAYWQLMLRGDECAPGRLKSVVEAMRRASGDCCSARKQ